MPNMLKHLRELSWAEHNVVTNSVKVKIRLQKSIDDIIVVAPHCAPAFIMELAHYFAVEKKSSFVKPYLNLIHKLEKTHNLPIDYDQRMTYFVEFAGCKKVVTGDIMWTEAENLAAQGFTPQRIIDYLAQIIIAVTRHDNLHDIWWRLGRSEDLSGDSVDNIMLKAVISAQKLLPQAIDSFRKTKNAQSIRKLIRENREYQEQLIAAQPWGRETDACYELLHTTEAWQELTHNPRRLAEWLLNHFTSPSPRTRAWVINAIKQAQDGFDGMTLPAKKLGYGSLNIIDALVDAGATWDNPDGPTTLYGALWTRWCRELDEIEGDLPAIAADPHLRRSVSDARPPPGHHPKPGCS